MSTEPRVLVGLHETVCEWCAGYCAHLENREIQQTERGQGK